MVTIYKTLTEMCREYVNAHVGKKLMEDKVIENYPKELEMMVENNIDDCIQFFESDFFNETYPDLDPIYLMHLLDIKVENRVYQIKHEKTQTKTKRGK